MLLGWTGGTHSDLAAIPQGTPTHVQTWAVHGCACARGQGVGCPRPRQAIEANASNFQAVLVTAVHKAPKRSHNNMACPSLALQLLPSLAACPLTTHALFNVEHGAGGWVHEKEAPVGHPSPTLLHN